MKKLITVVLAIVLALAISAPAMAKGGDLSIKVGTEFWITNNGWYDVDNYEIYPYPFVELNWALSDRLNLTVKDTIWEYYGDDWFDLQTDAMLGYKVAERVGYAPELWIVGGLSVQSNTENIFDDYGPVFGAKAVLPLTKALSLSGTVNATLWQDWNQCSYFYGAELAYAVRPWLTANIGVGHSTNSWWYEADRIYSTGLTFSF